MATLFCDMTVDEDVPLWSVLPARIAGLGRVDTPPLGQFARLHQLDDSESELYDSGDDRFSDTDDDMNTADIVDDADDADDAESVGGEFDQDGGPVHSEDTDVDMPGLVGGLGDLDDDDDFDLLDFQPVHPQTPLAAGPRGLAPPPGAPVLASPRPCAAVNDIECVICRGGLFDNSDAVQCMRCGKDTVHLFHRACIEAFLTHNRAQVAARRWNAQERRAAGDPVNDDEIFEPLETCPICRQPTLRGGVVRGV